MKKGHFFTAGVLVFTIYTIFHDKSDHVEAAQTTKAEVNPQLGEICKATAAMTFGHDYKIMKLDRVNTDGIAFVHYNRPSDNSRWAIKCRLEGYNVIWASDNPDSLGRWRNDPLDGELWYSISSYKLSLTQKYSDGSVVMKTYELK